MDLPLQARVADGVLRPLSADPSRLDPVCVGIFEESVIAIPNYRIVITSTWRLAYSLAALKKLFSAAVAENIVGVTPEVWSDTLHTRHAEILAYLDSKYLNNKKWIAIDDDPDLYPGDTPLLITDPQQGFDEEAAMKLKALI